MLDRNVQHNQNSVVFRVFAQCCLGVAAMILNREWRCASISGLWPLRNHFQREGETRIYRGTYREEHCRGINHA